MNDESALLLPFLYIKESQILRNEKYLATINDPKNCAL